MSGPDSETASPSLSAQLRQYYRNIVSAHADDPAVGVCVLCKVARCPQWRYAYERLACAGERPQQPDPWRGLINGGGGTSQ